MDGTKSIESKDLEADVDSLANAPRVHLTGKRYWPVLEMLRFHWLPGKQRLCDRQTGHIKCCQTGHMHVDTLLGGATKRCLCSGCTTTVGISTDHEKKCSKQLVICAMPLQPVLSAAHVLARCCA